MDGEEKCQNISMNIFNYNKHEQNGEYTPRSIYLPLKENSNKESPSSKDMTCKSLYEAIRKLVVFQMENKIGDNARSN